VMAEPAQQQKGVEWQIGVWNRMSDVYLREIDSRFAPVVHGVLARAGLANGEDVVDLGTGTGSVAQRAAGEVGPTGSVTAVDVSPDMLTLAQGRFSELGLNNVSVTQGRAESIPAGDASFDAVLASLSLMYVIDREAAAREIARVLRPGGRLVAAVWAGPDECDIVLFQTTAGRFAGPPPVPGVGPGALADPSGFIRQLAAAGVPAHVEKETVGFDFANFASAWEVLAGVTTANLSPEEKHQAKQAVKAAMYELGDGPRHFRNTALFIEGRKV
jgi:SAM-dependent methyltransferase